MLLNQTHRKQFTISWLAIFYVLAAYKWWQDMWLYQADPFMFVTRFDGITWQLLQTGLHRLVMQQSVARYVADGIFYSLPLVYGILFLRKPRIAAKLAWVWLLANWLYVQLYTSYPINSIEAHIAWLLFPVLFAMASLPSYYYILQALRYFFLYFFVSAGIWKLVQGGAFYPGQMSAILLEQHKEWLVTSPAYWHAEFIYWLIDMPLVSFLLYWMGILIELFFVVGFFTKRYDHVLIALFMLFLGFDYFLMRIPYFEVTPFLLTLWHGRYRAPVKHIQNEEKVLPRQHPA